MHFSFVNNAKMDKAISMKFSVYELVSCMCFQMYFSYQCGPFINRNRHFCNEKPKNGENTLNFISKIKLKILVKNDRKLIFELRCNNILIMYNNF